MAKMNQISNFHVLYEGTTTQHWHPTSARYAGGDNLMTAVNKGWEVEKCVLVRHWYAGMRSIKVYEFHLNRSDDTMIMPVVDNPYIERLLKETTINLEVSEDAKI